LRKSLGLFSTPVVVKADGLAAGKGVVIAHTKDEAANAGAGMFNGKLLGVPSTHVVLEEFLTGDELSFLVLSDGERVAPLVASQDHKRAGESDLVEAIEACIEGRVSEGLFHWSPDASCCVVVASGGYPGSFVSGKKISGVEQAAQLQNVKIFHAGTTRRDGAYYTNGGRVLG